MLKYQRILFGAGLVVLPFIFSTEAEGMRQPKARFLAFLAGIFISLEIWRKISPVLGCGSALIFLSAIFVSPIFPQTDLLVFTAALLSGLLVAKAGKDDVKAGFKLFEFSGFLCLLYAGLQYIGRDPIMTMLPGADYKRVSVFFGQHTLYGPFAVAACASALFHGRYLLAALLALPVFAIDSSFTYFSLLTVLSVFAVYKMGRGALLALALVSVTAGPVLLHDSLSQRRNIGGELLNDNGRFALWSLSYRLARAQHWKGRGLGSFALQFPFFQNKNLRIANGLDDATVSPAMREVFQLGLQLKDLAGTFLSPHNEFIWAYYELGIWGAIAAPGLILAFLWAFLSGPRRREHWACLAIFLAFCANACGNFIFHLIPQGLLPLWAFVIVTVAAREGNLKS